MTDQEFDVLDELYFIKSFENLTEELDIGEAELKSTLIRLKKKNFIKILTRETEEEVELLDNFDKNYKFYNYLATKQGLLAHNGR